LLIADQTSIADPQDSTWFCQFQRVGRSGHGDGFAREIRRLDKFHEILD